jgi:hypothetical protein
MVDFAKKNAEKAAVSTEVATTAAALPAVAGAYDYGADAGVGFEGTTAKDLSIPFIGILQSNSPQVEDGGVAGAKPGMLINTVTNDLIDGDKGQAFIPVHYDRAFVEWVPRTKGGGFVGLHDINSELVKSEQKKQEDTKTRGKIILATGNELIETEYCYCLTLDTDFVSPTGFAVLSLTSTKLTPFRKFKTSLFMLKGKPPLFVNRAILKTDKQKNDKGTFYNAKFVPVAADWKTSLIPNTAEFKDLIEEAKSFRAMVLSGMAKAAFETQNVAGDTGSGNTEDAPF